MDSQEHKECGPRSGDGTAALRRAGYLFAAAFAFRLQLWLFALGQSPWTDLLRVDILNAMGFALLVFSPMTVFRTVERIRLCAILGLAVAGAAPVVTNLDWRQVFRQWCRITHSRRRMNSSVSSRGQHSSLSA